MNLAAVAKLKFDMFVPGHDLKIRERFIPNGGIDSKGVNQIIVTGDFPKGEVDNIVEDRSTGQTSVNGRTTVSNAILSAQMSIFRNTSGVSTYIVGTKDWLDMFEMKYGEIEKIKALNLDSKFIVDGKKVGFTDDDKDNFLAGVKCLLSSNGLDSNKVTLYKGFNPDQKILVEINVKDLPEVDLKKSELLVSKLNEHFKEFASIYMNWGIENKTSPKANA